MDAALAAIAQRQHGVFSAAQAFKVGFTRAMARARLEAGRWGRVHAGVYVLIGSPPTARQRLLAACLWGGPDAVASHRSAAFLWGLDRFEQPRLAEAEISVPVSRHKTVAGVLVHQRRSLSPKVRRVRENIPVTAPLQTLVDLASVTAPEVLELACEDALRKRLVTLKELRSRLRGAKHGQQGLANLRALLAARGENDHLPDSELERRFLRLIRRAGLPIPVHHHQVLEEDGPRLVAELDFAYPDQRLGIQVHGYRYHQGMKVWQRGQEQLAQLAALGWRVIPVTHKDLTSTPERVVDRTRRALESTRRT